MLFLWASYGPALPSLSDVIQSDGPSAATSHPVKMAKQPRPASPASLPTLPPTSYPYRCPWLCPLGCQPVPSACSRCEHLVQMCRADCCQVGGEDRPRPWSRPLLPCSPGPGLAHSLVGRAVSWRAGFGRHVSWGGGTAIAPGGLSKV